jgi:hypothetical protein
MKADAYSGGLQDSTSPNKWKVNCKLQKKLRKMLIMQNVFLIEFDHEILLNECYIGLFTIYPQKQPVDEINREFLDSSTVMGAPLNAHHEFMKCQKLSPVNSTYNTAEFSLRL